MEKWRNGEHGEHGKDGKHQPDDILFTLFMPFKLHYTAYTAACIPIIREGLAGLERCWNGMMGFCAKCWVTDGRVMDGVEWRHL